MPLTLLASANALIGVIQQGCEMYTEYKGTIAKAQKTYKQVQQITTEVKSFWGFLKDKLFNKPKPPPDPIVESLQRAAKETKQDNDSEADQPEQLDETSVYNSIAKNLVKYFRLIEQIQEKLREAEEKSRDIHDPNQNLMEVALNRVLIEDQLVKMSTKLREVMCWNTPTELGDLYNKVNQMRVKIIDEQNEIRDQERRKQAYRKWRKQQIVDQIKVELLALAMTVFLLLEMGAIWVQLIDRIGYR